MEMTERKFVSEGYRWGFNGMERDDEFKGSGNSVDFGARMYDARLGRWFITDPFEGSYVPISPFSFGLNSPIFYKDVEGDKIFDVNGRPIDIIDNAMDINKYQLDLFTKEILEAMIQTEYGKSALNAMIVAPTIFTFEEDPSGSKISEFARSVPEPLHFLGFKKRRKGLYTKVNIYINTHDFNNPTDRFAPVQSHVPLRQEFLNSVVVHEAVHNLNKRDLLLYRFRPFWGEAKAFAAEFHAREQYLKNLVQQGKVSQPQADAIITRARELARDRLYKIGNKVPTFDAIKSEINSAFILQQGNIGLVLTRPIRGSLDAIFTGRGSQGVCTQTTCPRLF